MKKLLSIFVFAALVSGCSLLGKQNCSPVALWTKPGADPSTPEVQAAFYTAKFMCVQQSQFGDAEGATGLNWVSYNACMKAFGFVPVE